MAEVDQNSSSLVSSPGSHGLTAGTDASSSVASKHSLLVVVGEPFNEDQKRLIVERLSNELLSWDAETSGCDLNLELQSFMASPPAATDGQSGEKLIDYATQNLRIVVLINPLHKTLISSLRSFLLGAGSYRHLVYTGLCIQRSGCWVLQDSVLSFSSFADVFRGSDVCSAIKSGAVSGQVNLNVFAEGEWLNVNKLAPQLQMNVNRPAAQQIENSTGITQFCNHLSSIVTVTSTHNLLQSTTVIGNIRFNRPTLYVFPAAQGDSALFGISGFNLLVNGGYSRRACFWDFTRHLDRIDALLVTHIGIDNMFGLGSVVERKVQEPGLHPEIGYVYLNACAKPKDGGSDEGSSENGGKKSSKSLLLSLSHEASHIVENIRHIGLTVHPCVCPSQATQPINLYHKVGSGSLDMYVLNPGHDSKALKDFLTQWSKHADGFTFSKSGVLPLAHSTSICMLIVWRPAAQSESITRLLFTGTTPQPVIFEGLDRLKGMALFQSAACSEKELAMPAKGTARKGSVKSTPTAPQHQKQPTAVPASAVKSETTTVHAKPSSAAAAGKTTHSAATPASKTDVKEKKKPMQKKDASHADTSTTKTTKDPKSGNDKSPIDGAAIHIGATETPASPEESSSSANTTASLHANAESLSGHTSVDATPLTETESVTMQTCMETREQFDAGAEDGLISDSLDHQSCDMESVPTDHEVQHESGLEEPHGSHDYSGSDRFDADKDIDASVDDGHAQSVHASANCDDHSTNIDAPDDEIFDGESPDGLTQPAEGQPLIRSDSLEGDLCQAAHGDINDMKSHDENMPIFETNEEHQPASSQFSPTNNLLDMAGLQSEAAENLATSNPFVGISDFGDGMGGEPYMEEKSTSEETSEQSDVVHNARGIQSVDVFEHGEHHESGAVDRDSLEREEAFDPRTQWDHPMGLPAPNKVPGSSKSDHDASHSADNSAAAKKSSGAHGSKSATGTRTNGKDQTAAASNNPAAASNDDSKVGESARKPPAALGKKGRPSTVGSGDPHGSVTKETKPDVKPPSADKPASAVKTQQFKKPAVIPPKSSSAPLKPVVPFYVELAYIPAHGNAAYLDGDFFRRVRARYYVLSTTCPDASILTSLLDAKATWEDHDAQVTIIPTYDADVLRYWMGAHRDTLSQMKIDVAPSANRCSIQLQDQEASSAAYRLEF